MDNDDTNPEADTADGIYSTCPLCFAIVAHAAGHTAWHESRGEQVT